jgi:CTP:molybdopterin cytidylyltransferase MocA
MGSPKPLVKVRGESFLVRATRLLWTSCDRVVVVLGANAARVQKATENEFQSLVAEGLLHSDIRRSRGGTRRGLEVRFVVHRGWKQGMYSSARVGLKAAADLKPRAVILLPVDHPAVRAESISGLSAVMEQALEANKKGRERARFSYALVPRYLKRRGHPLVLSPALAHAIAADATAEHLGDAVRRHARLVGYLDVSDPGVLLNRNTRRAR